MISSRFVNKAPETEKKPSKIYPFKVEKDLTIFKDGCPTLSKEDLHLHTAKGVAWGNLKLFIFLLQFINYYVTPTISSGYVNYCVYVGAAPGVSISVVAQMYPSVEFHLYDPFGGEENKIHEKFDSTLRNLPNVVLYEKEFSSSDADMWKQVRDNIQTPTGLRIGDGETNCVYFVSDIRNRNIISSEESKKDPTLLTEREMMIRDDMLLQQEWVEKINPNKACLKFRPYHLSAINNIEDQPLENKNDEENKINSHTFEYLDGMIFRQAFEKSTSFETRLVVRDNFTKRNWDIGLYEGALDYHNYVYRSERLFLNPLDGTSHQIDQSIGLTRDYDSCLFVTVIKQYQEIHKQNILEKDILNICEAIQKSLIRNYGGKTEKDLYSIRNRKSRSSSEKSSR